jgi:hypothetical protein
MSFCTIEFFHENDRRKTGVDSTHQFPCDRQQMADARRLSCFLLPMAARQADWRSHCPYVSFFRYFVLANRSRARDDWAGAGVTGVSGKVKIVFSHGVLQGKSDMHQILGFLDGYF